VSLRIIAISLPAILWDRVFVGPYFTAAKIGLVKKKIAEKILRW